MATLFEIILLLVLIIVSFYLLTQIPSWWLVRIESVYSSLWYRGWHVNWQVYHSQTFAKKCDETENV